MANKHRAEIPEPKIEKGKKLTFSFEFYDKSKKYCLGKFSQKDVSLAIERLQQLNAKTLLEIFRDKKVLHFHEVDWSKTIERNGFPYTIVNNMSPFQFSLNGINCQKARVYGAFKDGVFYIVWFDLEHEIWPSFKKHT